MIGTAPDHEPVAAVSVWPCCTLPLIEGRTTFTGAGVYTEESKYVKVDFKDIEKDKHPYPAAAKDGWIAMVQHYFVSAWAPKQGAERDFFTTHVVDNLYTAGLKVPMGTIAPGETKSVSCGPM